MSAGQLWLFPPPKPLVERFGKEFFHQLPEQPGVYLFCGEREGVLYVGSAKNLKKRLAAYRVSNPERFPRRIIRLLNEVRRIEFDVCASEATARHREEELICTLLPKFNRAGKVWPRSSWDCVDPLKLTMFSDDGWTQALL
jgi:DNA polymerase III subunit epsilon